MLQKETENWRCLYIYIQEALKFTNFSLQKHCKEQDIEITAVQLKLNKKNVIIFCVYRAVIIFCVYRAVIIFCIRGLLEKYPTFGREKETGLLGALDT